MAKGRRVTASRSERYLGTYAGQSHSHGVAVDGSDFSEEDVWSTVGGGGGGGQYECYAARRERLSLAFEESGRTTLSRMVQQFRGQDAGAHPPRRQQMATSAPMNVPDWSKILRVDSVESMQDSDDGYLEEEAAVDPPHEYLARCRKTAATSVFEGVGRTLKGRDMSRLRDAVWTHTGFDG